MKSDINGCSTCAVGEECFEKVKCHTGRNGIIMFQYDYRDTDGELFSCVASTLKRCREKRAHWLNAKLKKAGL